MSAKAKSRPTRKKKFPHSIVWFEIPADNPERARGFYSALFGWKITPFPTVKDYWHIDTGGSNESVDGGLMMRMHSSHTTTHYVLVPSVTEYMAKVKKLGGKICRPKTPVPKMGHFAICEDTEGNQFAVWEMDPNAKPGA
jgi:uncharacterized protein